MESVQLVRAVSMIFARLRQTVVDVDFAVLSGQPRNAAAHVMRHFVNARGSAGARIAAALVDVVGAVLAVVSGRANAFVVVHQVLAGGAVFAGLRQALVDVCIAEQSRVTGSAVAFERSGLVDANAVVTAVGVRWRHGTLVNVRLAVCPCLG